MAHQNADNPPEVIFVNGDIYPGSVFEAGADGALTAKPAGARAQAIAVRAGRVVAIGSNADIRRLRGHGTREIDLGGHFAMPGFNDAHAHMAQGGFEELVVNLVGSASLDEMKARIAAKATHLNPGEWLQGGGWDHTKWPGGSRLPNRQDLDEVTAGHPAFFSRVDGHIAVANSAALQRAGIMRNTPDPPGGRVDRDSSGEPTGILRETAKALVSRKIPAPSPSHRRRAAELALANAVRWGLTSAQDNSSWEDFLVYEDMEREGKLPLRIAEWLPFPAPITTLEQHRSHHASPDLMLHATMLKGFMDGSLGSRTAALKQAYSDDAGNRGLPQFEQDKLNALAAERALAGFQLGFHAIGDAAVQMALDAFRQAEQAVRQRGNTPERGFRFRVEHAQVTDPPQFAEFQELGVIASMQPNHLLTDMNWAESRLGRDRAAHSYAWKSFLRRGVWLAFGTDYPVEPITPFRGIYAAVTRRNEAGDREYFAEEKLTIEEALAAYTSGSAWAEFAEKEKGSLEPGKLADFVVLDRDLTKVPAAEILKTEVLRTVVGGKTVYEAGRP
ncbi:MAG: amidohydrolase [Acidobacteria bacterium]|nr:amidohydrolase [Acidobacteriota bacterium]